MSIQLQNINYSVSQKPILTNIDLNIGKREFLTLLGASGSGKTTLLRVIAGLNFADSGTILFNDQDMTQDMTYAPAQARKFSVVFQNYALFKHMSVAENISFGLRMQPRKIRLTKPAIAKIVDDLLDLAELAGYQQRYPEQLSGGQQQRVAILRALAVSPKALLLDEPFSALDIAVRKSLRKSLKTIHQNLAIPMIFVTHDQDEALSLSDRIAVMDQGRIVQVDSVEQLLAQPANDFVRNFIQPSDFVLFGSGI